MTMQTGNIKMLPKGIVKIKLLFFFKSHEAEILRMIQLKVEALRSVLEQSPVVHHLMIWLRTKINQGAVVMRRSY